MSDHSERDHSERDHSERQQFIKALRDCADFFERHPGVGLPSPTFLNIFVLTREDVAAYAKLATWEKIYMKGYFCLRRTFNSRLMLDITAPRETVCRRVVTGKQIVPARPEQEIEVVEWICDDPLLARVEVPVGAVDTAEVK